MRSQPTLDADGPKVAKHAAQQSPFSFREDASIVLTGPRGNGKSSLAIMAGLLLQRRVIDADDQFTTKFGCSIAGFKRRYGAEKCLNEQIRLTKGLLTQYGNGCIISCGPYITAESCRALMMGYKSTNPIIYVRRATSDIADYLGVEENKLQQWIETVHAKCLGICNFEFFNLPEMSKEITEQCPAQERLKSVLRHRLVGQKKVQALQKTAKALARFLAAALGHHAAPLSDTSFPTLYPTAPEHRVYSNVVCFAVSSLLKDNANLGHIAEGMDAVELVHDCRGIRGQSMAAVDMLSRFVAEIRHVHALPVIYHVQMTGDNSVDSKAYFELLNHGFTLAPEYLTVDLGAPDAEIRQLFSKRGRTKIIGHHQIPTALADYWLSREPFSQYERAIDLGCHVVRLVSPGDIMAANFSCLALVSKVHGMPTNRPVIAYNTGHIGNLSRVCNPVLSPIVHASDGPTYPSNLRIRERWRTLFTLRALDPLHFFVIGSSVRKSISPAMHNAAFSALGMPHVYRVHETTSLEGIEALFEDPEFGGASVSLPFKTEILSMVEELSPAAQLIGSSNTILPIRHVPDHTDISDPRDKKQRHRAGPISMLYADNTDWMGISACVSRSISPANSINTGTAALVIGAGGIARAAVYSLMRMGVRNICIFNRTVSRARNLVDHFEKVFDSFLEEKHNRAGQPKDGFRLGRLRMHILESITFPWPEEFRQPSIIICAIKAYDHQNSATHPFKMPHSWMKNPTGGIVVELAYHTPETPVMEQLREENPVGWTVVDPIEVFFEQACAQWELFTGSPAPRQTMWQACLNDYAEKMKNNDYGSMRAEDV